MADAGYVEAGERGRRDRKPYAITEAGRAAFAARIRREPGPETIRFLLLMTKAFARHVPPKRLSASSPTTVRCMRADSPSTSSTTRPPRKPATSTTPSPSRPWSSGSPTNAPSSTGSMA